MPSPHGGWFLTKGCFYSTPVWEFLRVACVLMDVWSPNDFESNYEYRGPWILKLALSLGLSVNFVYFSKVREYVNEWVEDLCTSARMREFSSYPLFYSHLMECSKERWKNEWCQVGFFVDKFLEKDMMNRGWGLESCEVQ